MTLNTASNVRDQNPAAVVAVVQASKSKRHRQWRRSSDPDGATRGLLSPTDKKRPRVRLLTNIIIGLLVLTLLIVCAGPALMLAKFAVSTTSDIIRDPFGWWPSGVQWQNLGMAWTRIKIGQYTVNTVILAAGTVLASLTVALTGGYAVAVLKPKYAGLVNAAVMATLFIPGIVALIPLYLTVIELRLINTFLAVWLPSAASAFNFLLVRQFAANIPAELFEAARIDGAGPFRMFFSIFLPMTRPIVGVIVLLSFTGAWKEFLWPLLALPSPDLQPLSVALTKVSATAETSLLMAGMFITVLIPVALFFAFQSQFLKSAGAAGAIKG